MYSLLLQTYVVLSDMINGLYFLGNGQQSHRLQTHPEGPEAAASTTPRAAVSWNVFLVKINSTMQAREKNQGMLQMPVITCEGAKDLGYVWG